MISYYTNKDVYDKINIFNRMCGTFKTTLKNTCWDTKFKFYTAMPGLALVNCPEC